jgi:hypothetical protein
MDGCKEKRLYLFETKCVERGWDLCEIWIYDGKGELVEKIC